MPTEPIDYGPPPIPAVYVPMTRTRYPETTIHGLGIDHCFPTSRWIFARWPALERSDYFGLRIGNLERPLVFDLVVDKNLDRYELTVDASILPEGEHDMLGRIVRVASGQASRSITQKILVKTTRPGGDDRRLLEPWHSELVMRITNASTGVSILDGEILDDATISDGLICLITKYPNCRKNDQIIIKIDGRAASTPYIVSPADAAGRGPIRVPIEESDIRRASQFGTVQIFFTVLGVVGNRPGGKYIYSKPFNLISEMDPNLIAGPIFFVRPTGTTESVETNLVDLDIDSNSTFSVRAVVTRQRVAPRPPHQIKISVEATLSDGTTTVTDKPLVNDTNIGGETIPIEFEFINNLTGGTLRISFKWLTAAGVLVKQSASTLVRVVGERILMPPVISAQIESGLIADTADLSVQMPDYQPFNEVWPERFSMTPLQNTGGLEPYAETQLAGPQGGTRRVTLQNVQRYKGVGLLAIGYSTDEGRPDAQVVRTSKMRIAQIGERIPVLPPVIVQGVVDNNIDPAKMKDPELLFNIPYDGTALNDVVVWSVVGQNQAGSANGKFKITTANAGTSLPSIGIPVPRVVLDNNNENIISFTYSVTDSTVTPPRILRSEVRYVSVGKALRLEIPKVLEANKLQNQINPKDTLKGANVENVIRPLRDDDEIFTQWQGAFGVSSIEVAVDGDSTTNKVIAYIPPEVIAKAIRPDGNTISVSYNFTRGPFDYPSVTRDFKLLPLTGLPTPRIDGFTLGALPVYKLTQDPYFVVDKWDYIAENQYWWATCKGTNADGTAYEREIANEQLITEDEVSNGVSIPLPLDEIMQLKEGTHLTLQFSVSFAQVPGKDTAVPFGTRDYIVQTMPSTLPAPAFAGKTGAALTIDPLLYEQTAFVTVAYPSMTTATKITLFWTYADGTEAAITPLQGTAAKSVNFTITRNIIAASVGRTITLRYSSATGTSVVWSDVQTLTVQTIRVADLPRALINGIAHGGTLDLDNFKTSTLALPTWRLSTVGQRVTINGHMDGVAPINILDAYPITATEVTNGLRNVPVPQSWVANAISNGRMELVCEVAFDGRITNLPKVKFPTTEYTVTNVPTLINDTSTFQNSSLNGWQTFVPDYKDLSFTTQGLLNYTFTNRSQGMVLRKTINNMKVGSTYRFSMNALRADGRFDLPILSLFTNQGQLTGFYYLTQPTFITMIGVFVANTTTMNFMLFNSQPSGVGNDYVVANAVIARVS